MNSAFEYTLKAVSDGFCMPLLTVGGLVILGLAVTSIFSNLDMMISVVLTSILALDIICTFRFWFGDIGDN
ncbi:hypothetical protein C5167_037659 [Papaver somniferum]|uniref:Uncharacterized protein n=1 Tax=Papaver somniferum TaxID=3469 RepID=A0A4Y7IAF3_PAPSO|nr:hypothetical protein C5167_037659 [Papaver somniferum]